MFSLVWATRSGRLFIRNSLCGLPGRGLEDSAGAAATPPSLIWLWPAPMLAAIRQLVIDGVVGNVKLKSFYNPGLGAVPFLHMRITIYYIYPVQSHGLASVWDWGVAVVYMIAFMAISLVNKRLAISRLKSVFVRIDRDGRRATLTVLAQTPSRSNVRLQPLSIGLLPQKTIVSAAFVVRPDHGLPDCGVGHALGCKRENITYGNCDSECDPGREHTGLRCDIEEHNLLDLLSLA